MRPCRSSRTTKAIQITANDKGNTITGGADDDTLTGGWGADVFVYTGGNDVITDYSTIAGDKISLGAAIDKATLSGSDVLLTIGQDTLTVKGANGKKLNFIDATGKIFSKVVKAAKTVTLTDKSSAKITLPKAYSSTNGSKRTKAITIVGNALDNTIEGGSGNDAITGGAGADSLNGGAGKDKLWGGSGNDTLWGGSGNDTLYGGVGADVFCYSTGDGFDTVADFTAGEDKIYLSSGTIRTVTTSGDTIIFKIGNGSIKVLNGKNKLIAVTFADGSVSNYFNGNRVSSDIPSDAVTYNGNSYKLLNDGMTWEEARAYCESMGGHLVTITNSGEQSFVESLLVNGSKNNYWLGGYKTDSGAWQWTTGESFSYSHWSYKDPDNYMGVEDRLLFLPTP